MPGYFLFAGLFLSQAAMADVRFVCIDSGNTQGSYSLDITGYQDVLDGRVLSFERMLGFKEFRSIESPVSEVVCTQPIPFLDGPAAVFACRSGIPRDDGNGNYTPPFEAIILKGQMGLVMKVNGPDIKPAYNIPCLSIEMTQKL